MHRDDREPRHLHDLGDLPLDPDIDEAEDRHHHGAPVVTAAGRLPRFSARVLAAVYAGGVLGGLARYEINRALPAGTYDVPWATLAVNTAGAFCLALLLAVLLEATRPRWWPRPLLGTGFLGAFTTFSSVVTTTDRMAAHGHAVTAAAYVLGSIALGLLAAGLGLLAGRTVAAAGLGTRLGRDEPAEEAA